VGKGSRLFFRRRDLLRRGRGGERGGKREAKQTESVRKGIHEVLQVDFRRAGSISTTPSPDGGGARGLPSLHFSAGCGRRPRSRVASSRQVGVRGRLLYPYGPNSSLTVCARAREIEPDASRPTGERSTLTPAEPWSVTVNFCSIVIAFIASGGS